MKTFKDLEFKPHPSYPKSGLQDRLDFSNGYGISVVRFKLHDSRIYGSYTVNDNEWEVGIFYNKELCYSTPITDDAIGRLSEEEVSEIMIKIQELEPNK